MTIDRARRTDVPRILEIANWAAAHTTANFATAPETLEEWHATFDATHVMYPWLVMRAGHEPARAFAKASSHRARGAYAWTAEVSVYVAPEFHGQGIGRRLYDELIPILKAQGYAVLLAGITSPNPASERLHAAVGFTRCATYHRIGHKDGQWLDVGYWELVLNSADAPPGPIKPVEAVYGAGACF